MSLTELPVADDLFPGFRLLDVTTTGVRIRVRTGGEGPPLLLLHGYPQTHIMWRRVAPALAQRFTLVCPDLRGYGDSQKPPSAADHAPYSKRAMAQDMAEVMTALGHERFCVGSHDRGARVGHRLALDHGERVLKLATLDIAPTREMYRDTSDAFARAYWHWFFLIQAAPMPERMIGADPEFYWTSRRASDMKLFEPAALNEYLRCFRDPAMIHASCEDYRAAATIDIAHDDGDGGRTIACPLLALWGDRGAVGKCFDVLALWRERAENVQGRALPGGHYLAEEIPDLVVAEFSAFFGENT
ncbi:MAG: alpha/beta hydrolase [Bosea sp.]|uniref:alpha/beta fold hydrolase n=1 Tax=Bosea sp. (in: a-proteobacteria) TaxID=1871050 RepID=UPI002392C32E|nr:alpha/beta hydrolase [Bosea sp. (in: a-proteobacteria)]MCP4739083.1 alpha/beta hydrolase [Bosea sp. (in: a-proteobacteria)]